MRRLPLAAVVVAIGCASEPMSQDPPSVQAPDRVEAISPVQQVTLAGTFVNHPPAVRVLAESGNPVAGVTVAFASIGGSSGAPVPVVTDARGVAR